MAWDYPNGAAIAFILLGLWLALAPPRGMSDCVRWIAVGFLWAIAGTNNLLALLVILPCCMMVLYLAEFSLAESARRTGLILTGVGLMLVSFGIVSKWLFGTFLFLGPQIGLVVHAMTTPDFLSNMWGKGYDWISTAYRNAALLGICGAALVILATTARNGTDKVEYRTATAVIGLFVVSLCAFAVLEFVLQGVVLRVPYTSVYLVAPAYLALAASLSLLMQQWPARARPVFVAIGVIILVAVPFAVTPILALAQRFPWSPWLLQAAPVLLVLTAFFLPAGVFRRSVSILGAAALIALPALAATADKKLHWVFRDSEPTFDAALEVSNVLRSGVAKNRRFASGSTWASPTAPNFFRLGRSTWRNGKACETCRNGASRRSSTTCPTTHSWFISRPLRTSSMPGKVSYRTAGSNSGRGAASRSGLLGVPTSS
jgi:hypothetical protein